MQLTAGGAFVVAVAHISLALLAQVLPQRPAAVAPPAYFGPGGGAGRWSLHTAAGDGTVRRGPSQACTHTTTQQMKAEGRGRDAVWAHSTD